MQMILILMALFLMLGNAEAQPLDHFTHWKGSVPLNELLRISPIKMRSTIVTEAMHLVEGPIASLNYVDWLVGKGDLPAIQQSDYREEKGRVSGCQPIGGKMEFVGLAKDVKTTPYRKSTLNEVGQVESGLHLRYDGMWISKQRRMRVGLGYQLPSDPKLQFFIDVNVDQPRQPIFGIQRTIF